METCYGHAPLVTHLVHPFSSMEEDAGVSQALAELKHRWTEACHAVAAHTLALRSCGLQGGSSDSARLPRLNALAQDCLVTLRSLQRQFELLAQQLVSAEEKDSCSRMVKEWKDEYQVLHSTLRSANLEAKANILRATKKERDVLLGGGQESTNLRCNLQTQAGMSAAAESITDSLRRTRQMMVQELERGANTLATLDESNTTLKKADTEYKGQRSLLMTTRGLLTVMKRQDVLDRIILVVGFIFFCLVVTYVFHQRIGTFKVLRASSSALFGASMPSSASSDMPQTARTPSHMQTSAFAKIRERLKPIEGEYDTDPPTGDSPDFSPTRHTEL